MLHPLKVEICPMPTWFAHCNRNNKSVDSSTRKLLSWCSESGCVTQLERLCYSARVVVLLSWSGCVTQPMDDCTFAKVFAQCCCDQEHLSLDLSAVCDEDWKLFRDLCMCSEVLEHFPSSHKLQTLINSGPLIWLRHEHSPDQLQRRCPVYHKSAHGLHRQQEERVRYRERQRQRGAY